MPLVKTKDGRHLYTKDWGDGPPIVLIHGWPLSADSWDDVAVMLAEAGHRVIAYDRRGFGRSSQPWSGYDYDTLADDLAAVITQTGVQDATLVGFSMGGGEVARYMRRHDGRSVSKAVLIASVLPYLQKTADNPDGLDPAVFDQMAKDLREDRPRFLEGFFKSFFGIGLLSRPVSDGMLQWAWTMAMQAGARPTQACATAFAGTDFRADLSSFTVPTLLIHGTDDATVPIDASSRRAVREIPGAVLVELDGAPHGLFATHRDRLAAELVAFVHR